MCHFKLGVSDLFLKVSGDDDDSNFDIVEDTPPVPDIASLKPSKEFRCVFKLTMEQHENLLL